MIHLQRSLLLTLFLLIFCNLPLIARHAKEKGDSSGSHQLSTSLQTDNQYNHQLYGKEDIFGFLKIIRGLKTTLEARHTKIMSLYMLPPFVDRNISDADSDRIKKSIAIAKYLKSLISSLEQSSEQITCIKGWHRENKEIGSLLKRMRKRIQQLLFDINVHHETNGLDIPEIAQF